MVQVISADRTEIGFKFAKAPPTEEMFTSSFFNGSLKLPAGAANVAVPGEIGFGRAVRVWGLMPQPFFAWNGFGRRPMEC